MADFKILMLLEHPLDIHDGRVERETKVLKENGYNIDIFTVLASHMSEIEVRDNYTIYRIIDPVIGSPFNTNYKKHILELVKIVKEGNYKVLHCHDYKLFVMGAQVAEMIPGLKLIYDSHEYLAGWLFYQDIKNIINRIKGKIVWKWFVKKEKQYSRIADAVLTVSQSIVDAMQKNFRLINPPILLRNIPWLPHAKNEKYFHIKYGINDSQKILLHSGAIYHNNKRMRLLIKGVKEVDGLCMVFLGIPLHKVDFYKSMVNEFNAGYKIFFHDPVPANKVTYYTLNADLGIVYTWKPEWKSHWYSLPNKIMELSVAGVPIICTSQPEFKRLGDEFGHAVYFDGNDYQGMINAFNTAIKNYTVIKQNALKVKDTLNWEKESEKLVSLYEKLTSTK